MTRFAQVALASAVLGALAFPAQAAQRAYVASYGSDANAGAGCLLNAPCRGFTAAHSAVDAGGEIVALDAAGYGAVTITKSVTITANPGYFAGIAASTGNAVTIATPGVNVTLRALNINSVGATNGISMTNGSRLSIENCVITNFGGVAVNVTTAADLRIVDSVLRDNHNHVLAKGGTTAISGSNFSGSSYVGIWIYPATGTATATITNSTITRNYTGVTVSADAGATAKAIVTHSNVSANQYGLNVEGYLGTQMIVAGYNQVSGNTACGICNYATAASFRSQGNNLVDQNTTNVAGAITTIPGM